MVGVMRIELAISSSQSNHEAQMLKYDEGNKRGGGGLWRIERNQRGEDYGSRKRHGAPKWGNGINHMLCIN